MKIRHIVSVIRNMGLRYTVFRFVHEAKARSGLLKHKFPTSPPDVADLPTLGQWRENSPKFFFRSKEELKFSKTKNDILQKSFEDICAGKYTFFSKLQFSLGQDYDWRTNPTTDHKYPLVHWSKIQDLDKEAGDIKFVWEKARFSFLYDLIRYDYHFEKDCSALVFSEIDSFLKQNPINLGPNYKCSQETSLRILNWTFALYYYKNSNELTEERFSKIMNAIYWQLHHVFHNINFSRIAVRNNHALTETLMLFLGGLLFPFMPNTKEWSRKGKKWFEEEIAYQIYKDGTFLQFSMNYHRVALQLLTWGIRLAEIHNNKLNATVYDRARKSLWYFRTCLDEKSGKMPNYGPNDGALFFKLTDDDYSVYTSQIDDLSATLYGTVSELAESQNWYGFTDLKVETTKKEVLNSFPIGGSFVINDDTSKTFIKCAKFKDRPTHSDNLHLDVWIDGKNYLWDTGSYKYNAEEKYTSFFGSCHSHNTISVGNKNQMLKGDRFIQLNWIKKASASLIQTGEVYKFEGQFTGFRELGKNISHKRIVEKIKGKNLWHVHDHVSNSKGFELRQYWQLNPETIDKVQIVCKDEDDRVLSPIIEEKWCSNYYGVLEKSIRYTYTSKTQFYTEIKIL